MVTTKKNIFVEWVRWHFVDSPEFLFLVWRDYLDFVANYFSVALLFKTFFAPWRRYSWRYPRGLDVVEFFGTLVSNTFSRFLGALMRTVLIIIGIITQMLVVVLGAIVVLFWVLMPFLIITGFAYILIY